VAEFIDIANSAGAVEVEDAIGPVFAFTNADLVLSTEEIDAVGGEHNAALLFKMQRIRVIAENWNEPARGLVLGHETPRLGPELERAHRHMIDLYIYVSGIRDFLSRIADENSRALGETSAPVYSLPSTTLFSLSLTVAQRPKSKRRTRRGDIEIGHAAGAVIEPQKPFRQFLTEVELDRIKRCAHESCMRIFWASRTDRPCCSESCRNAYKQKKHRDREKLNRPYRKRLLKKRSK
jgi:hypothetical protein